MLLHLAMLAQPAKATPPVSAPPPAPAAAGAPAPARVAPPAPQVDVAADLRTLSQLSGSLTRVTQDAPLAAMAARAEAIERQIGGALEALRQRLAADAAVLHRLDQRRRLTSAERTQKAALLARQQADQAQVARLQPVADRASQVFDQIAERRREGFSGRVLERAPSPVSPDFWTQLGRALGGDLARLRWLIQNLFAALLLAPEPKGLAGLVAGLVAGLIVAWPARRLAQRVGARIATAAGAGAARTLAIVWCALCDVVAAALGAALVRLGAKWGGLLSPAADDLAIGAIAAATWAAAVVAIGRALAAAPEAEGRLLPIPDETAAGIRPSLWAVALITATASLLQRLSEVAGAGVWATIALDDAVALAYAAAALLVLASVRRPEEGGDATAAGAAVWTLVSLALATAVLGTCGAVLLGYPTLAVLISSQIFWLAMIAATATLIVRLIDDVIGALASETSRAAILLRRTFGLRATTVEQVGLLVAAALQVLVLLAAVLLALTPFGASGHLMAARLSALGGDVRIGKATLSPIGLAGGILTFMLGLGLAHAARAWVERRYLPVTRWDAGVRNSVSTGVTYLGVAIAVVCALSVAGVRLAQIALVASALSVGVGFGLQQIVQNFVAGVILLIERPVKVGDWVSVGGVEGDVLALKVRATDIRSFDGSTVIVPNSSLISNNVVNHTLGGAHTRLQMPAQVKALGDVRKARDQVLEAIRGHPEVLAKPDPTVLVTGMADDGAVIIDARAWIADPRTALRIRSELYLIMLDVLADLEKAKSPPS